MPRKSTKKSAAGTASHMPNLLILAPMENRPLQLPTVMLGSQLQMVKIQQNKSAPIITTGGGFVPNFGGKVSHYVNTSYPHEMYNIT